MITSLLILSILIASINRTNHERVAIFSFCAYCAFSQYLLGLISVSNSFWYYLGSAITELLIIFTLSKISRPTQLIEDIQAICLWFAYLHVFGWILFESRFSHGIYDLLCGILFVLVFVRMNTGKRDNVGNTTICSGRRSIFSGNTESDLPLQANQAEVTT